MRGGRSDRTDVTKLQDIVGARYLSWTLQSRQLTAAGAIIASYFQKRQLMLNGIIAYADYPDVALIELPPRSQHCFCG